jgi:hypothetical protein
VFVGGVWGRDKDRQLLEMLKGLRVFSWLDGSGCRVQRSVAVDAFVAVRGRRWCFCRWRAEVGQKARTARVLKGRLGGPTSVKTCFARAILPVHAAHQHQHQHPHCQLQAPSSFLHPFVRHLTLSVMLVSCSLLA